MVLSQTASGSALPMDAFCISSLKNAPGSWREELGRGGGGASPDSAHDGSGGDITQE